MKYTVVWAPPAERHLAEVWTAADNRTAIAAAANALDLMLRRDAHLVGESRAGNTRVVFFAPLGIDFEVLQTDRLVRVLAVWRTDKRRE